MVVRANRVHAAGEQMIISYGPRPNTLLLRTYGFTLHPSDEPSWNFAMQGPKPHELYSKYLPPHLSELNLELDTRKMADSLIQALNEVTANGSDAAEFLREFCALCMKPYEADDSLRTPLQALTRARAKDETSGAWWSEMPSDALCESAADSYWLECCVRVKMSEYLCLMAHVEFVDHARGRLASERCFAK